MMRMCKKIIFWFAVTVIFIVSTLTITMMASGYRVNWPSLSMQKTGLIMLKGEERTINIKLDSKDVGNKLPLRIMYIVPGWHELTITKSGHYDWKRSIWVESGRAYEISNIALFKSAGEASIINDNDLSKTLADLSSPSDILYEDGEILANGKLVTRLSQEPLYINWYSDYSHILFQVGKQIRIVDTNGNNDTVLATLDNDMISKFKSIEGGRYLIYTDGPLVKKIQIAE